MQFINAIRIRLDIVAGMALLVWIAVITFGEFFNGATNVVCYPYFGCDSGFFGYDALEHFLFGFTAMWILVWLCKKFPHQSILNDTYWKSGVVLVTTVTCVAVVWEFGECFRDAYLLDIAHQQLINLRLHINYLAQPSNFDTMGDLAFNFVGSLLSLPFMSSRLQIKRHVNALATRYRSLASNDNYL